MVNYGDRLTVILESCPFPMTEIAEKVHLSPSTIYRHKAWVEGKDWGSKYTGKRATPTQKRLISRLETRCLNEYGISEELPYRESVSRVVDLVELEEEPERRRKIAEMMPEPEIPETVTRIEERPEMVPEEEVEYTRWRAKINWFGKHGGRNRRAYTEEFTATVEFSLPRDAAMDEAFRVSERLLDEGLDFAAYPSVGDILSEWHTRGDPYGIARIGESDKPVEFNMEQVSGEQTGEVIGTQGRVVLPDDAEEVWRRIR